MEKSEKNVNVAYKMQPEEWIHFLQRLHDVPHNVLVLALIAATAPPKRLAEVTQQAGELYTAFPYSSTRRMTRAKKDEEAKKWAKEAVKEISEEVIEDFLAEALLEAISRIPPQELINYAAWHAGFRWTPKGLKEVVDKDPKVEEEGIVEEEEEEEEEDEDEDEEEA